MTKRLILILVALAVIPILILLVGLALWTTVWSTSSASGGGGGAPILATPTLTPNPIEQSTPPPTAAAIPPDLNSEGIKLPASAKLATVDEAVAYARVWAKQDGASNPNLVSIHLETLKTALEANYREVGTDLSEAKIGHTPQELRHPVWRVSFGGTYHIPSCPAPVNSAIPDNCGTTTGVEYVIDAISGGGYATAYGVNPLPPTTP